MNEINVYLVPKQAEKADRTFPGWKQEIEISGLSLVEIVVTCLLFIGTVLVFASIMVAAR